MNSSAVKPDFRADINPNSLEVIKGSLLEVGFWPLAKKLYNDARKESRERTAKALANKEISNPHDADAPIPTSDQLVGNECIRFQGLRVAYFAVDSDAKLACLDEAEDVVAAYRPDDKIVLNRIVSLKEDAGKGAA